MMGPAAAVRAEDLFKTYPVEIRAVRGVSFSVDKGEAFGLLGPNGAGKTTTIGMLTTTVKPTSGSAFVGGHDVAGDPIGTRAVSSVVFQETVLDQPLTGRRNLKTHLKLWGVDPSVGARRIDELSAAVGLLDLLDRPVATYSGGQRRRLEIVRALLSAPAVLFLDEPTVGLDTRIRHDLFDVIGTLREKTGVTIIMTTHYLDEAERLCDRLAIIDKGVIVACDSPRNLLADVGDAVLEVRADEPTRAFDALRSAGLSDEDILVIGQTVTASLRTTPAHAALAALDRLGPSVRSATTRRSTLDDVYLRLTGDRIGGTDN
jgi:ABC-2 type transport system ATP-binding protein